MATLHVYPITDLEALRKRIKYSYNPKKTACPDFFSCTGIPGTLSTAINCCCQDAFEQMMETKRRFDKTDGVAGFHYYQSFKPGEVTPEEAHQIGVEFAMRCMADRFQVVIGTHTDKPHIHNHIVVNSVPFAGGNKYRSTEKSLYELRALSDELCREHGLSVIENPKTRSGKTYVEWLADKEKLPGSRQALREDIDSLILQSRTMEDFWDLMRSRGYQIFDNPRHKYISVRYQR